MPAVRATPQTVASLPGGLTTAARAGEPIAPTQPLEIGDTVCIVGKPGHEILPPGWVVHAAYRVLSHPGRLPDKGSERHTPFAEFQPGNPAWQAAGHAFAATTGYDFALYC
jgi:hypothetical protein